MSARTCKLCGKPLSRIRVGTEGDFCSREHRNQFRLRQGMERLMEANTVANLMRRRERLKSLLPRQTGQVPSVERRGFTQAQPVSVGTAMRIKKAGAAHQWGGALGQARRRQIALVRFHVLESAGAYRVMPILPRPSPGGIRPPKPSRAAAQSGGRVAAPARAMPIQAQRGVLLRVSGSAGFRLPASALPHVGPGVSTHEPSADFRIFAGRAIGQPAAMRALPEQWSTRQLRAELREPEFQLYPPWSSFRPGPVGIPGTNRAAGAKAPASGTARIAQVRFGLQESMRYLAESEEDGL